jgi:secernin
MSSISPESGNRRLFSCDTLVARAASGAPSTIFGKNSDRPCDEAQPLEVAPGATHPTGSYVRCQYLTIPQQRQTLAVLGSRPWWLWGFEQGVNEAGVAIGNEATYTRDEVPETGLLGMDLVRLGLERGATAREATSVIIDLLETFGQGGDSVYTKGFTARYHNSFIVADSREAYVLETSARHWVYRRTSASTAIGNLLTIEDDWDDASDGIETYAREQGWWWGPPGRKLNFRLAFEEPTMRLHTHDRYEASRRFLTNSEPDASVRAMMRHLRDHFASGTVHTPETPDSPRPRSVCCHPGRFDSATAASMVVELRADQSAPIAWCSMATPCTGVFLPVQVGSNLPASMLIGGGEEDDASLWWAMRALAEIVDHDPKRLTPPVQRLWGAWEDELLAATAADPASAARNLNARVEELLDRRSQLIETLADTALASAEANAS